MNLSKAIPVACAVLVFVIADSVRSSGQSPDANPQHTSICNAVAHPERFDGKLVRFHAKYAGTFEGVWITDQKCKDKFGQIMLPFQHGIYDDVVHQASRRYGITDVIRDDGWKQFEYASSRLFTGFQYELPDGTKTYGNYDSVEADLTGILVIKRGFRIKDGFGNGWGHLGMSRFLLVLRSASNVVPHPCKNCPFPEK